MAIQMRRGNEADLDITQLKPGEIAVCLDTGKIIVKLSSSNYLTLTDTDTIQQIVAGKAASARSHAQADVTGLADALAGKASTAVAVASSGGSGGSAGLMPAADKEKLNAFEISGISVVTQAQYEALDPPDSDTLYLITEASS